MKIQDIVKANPKATLDELVELSTQVRKGGYSREYLRKLRVKLGLPALKITSQNKELKPEVELEKDITVRSLKDKKRRTDKKYQALLEQNEIKNRQIEAFKVLQEVEFHTIKGRGQSKSEATAIVLCSDWHSEEKVKSSSVNGRNEFNLDIFEQRADKFFNSVVKLVQAKQKVIDVKTLVFALLGDFITGNLHEENVETCQLGVMEALLNAQSKIASGIRFLLDNTDVELVIPCHSGNHARITKKQRHATDADNSLEYVMYHTLAGMFSGEKRVKFLISPSYHSYLDVEGFKIRFHHGHDIRYGGGIGGLTIPVNKAIANWNTIENCDLDCFGHFHSSFFGGNFVCNGSLIGYNAYALGIKAKFERPRQIFFLVNHNRREVTDFCPIWID